MENTTATPRPGRGHRQPRAGATLHCSKPHWSWQVAGMLPCHCANSQHSRASLPLRGSGPQSGIKDLCVVFCKGRAVLRWGSSNDGGLQPG